MPEEEKAQPAEVFGLPEVRELIAVLRQSDITELLIERGSTRLHIKRMGHAGAPHPSHTQVQSIPPVWSASTLAPLGSDATPPDQWPVHATDEPAVEMPAGYTIAAPMVGIFFEAAAPGEPPFVQVGDEIQVGDTVGIIEAMKIMNEIESEVAGRVVRILVKNGQPVEYGQALMVVEPV